MLKVCVVTGSRAEYGLLYWVLKEIQADPDLELQLVVTGMHLAAEFGLTYQLIEQDGFRIDEKVDMLLASDTPVGVTKSMGLAVIGFADVFSRLRPDIVMLLGDRFEIFAAAQAALIALIPIAHIAGGDTTEGAFDEALRHSITKMSHLHFVTNAEAAQRVRQLGEAPEQIFMVGSPGLDHLRRTALLDRTELSRSLGFCFRQRNILVTFHPVTLEPLSTGEQCAELLTALADLGSEVGIILTRPNADTGGAEINDLIDHFVDHHPNAQVFASLGQQKYLSCLHEVDMVVGNSSSGLYEAPSFGIPTINIGNRQKGRLQAASVINCEPRAEEIRAAIATAFSMNCDGIINPYGDGNSAPRIVSVLKEFRDPGTLLKKRFYGVAP